MMSREEWIVFIMIWGVFSTYTHAIPSAKRATLSLFKRDHPETNLNEEEDGWGKRASLSYFKRVHPIHVYHDDNNFEPELEVAGPRLVHSDMVPPADRVTWKEDGYHQPSHWKRASLSYFRK
ncbi:hypothetical protein PHET_03237 [Paragonimus heterotremus]|uniref:Uncharacterized protein n=1 Tax=Paragonimus heterotremus TaxID=100268 RepID=A0A8J4TNJ4_9TREM|nr:hypothetical protein PHET_03237 [Paragonimus heterotremus]